MAPSQAASHSEGSPSHNSEEESDYQEHETRHSNAKSKTAGGSNSKKKPSTSRRASSQHASSAAGHLHDDPHHVDDPTDPQNARKMQNRLAQREFRARRLEHIKELEARVEFLSKPQSEQTEILVAIIHGLMDENKQLRGSLKTMANFVSTGLGGFSNAIQLPEYDNALELVNRGDRALLLKLVQEKGGSVGGGMSTSTSSSNHHVQQHAHHSSSTKQSAAKASPSPPATAGTSSHSGTTSGTPLHTTAACDKKRKHEEAQTGSKAPRTRSQNNRGRQETATTAAAATAGSSGEWPEQQQQQKQVQSQTGSVEPSPVPLSASSAPGTFGDPSRFVNTPEVQNQYLPRPASGMSMPQVLASTQMQNQNQNRDSRPNPDMFPSFLGQNNSLFSMDVFGATTPVGQSSGASNASSSFRGPGTIGGAVKQEESPPLAPFQDSAQAWMNAYTNLTPVGGNDSFWSLASSAMNDQSASNQVSQQQQMQRPQQGHSQSVAQASDPQDGRSPSSAFLSSWATTASATNNMGAFAMSQQSTQQPLHGYA